MNILKQELAPITNEGWEEINEQARQVFNSNLTARKFVDIDGPKGIEYSAVSNGRLLVKEMQNVGGVNYGIRKVQPLIEVRNPFELDLWELDNASRGAEDIDLAPLEQAASELAEFENQAIFNGFNEAGVEGLKASSDYESIPFLQEPEKILSDLGYVTTQLKQNGVEGPYNLVVNTDAKKLLLSQVNGYPLLKQIENAIEGEVIEAPGIDNAFMVSARGGDFRLTLGQDISIGYDTSGPQSVKLYFTESFTFQVLSPEAVFVYS